MGFLDSLINKNNNTLNHDEKEAAKILRDIICQIVPVDIEKLSIGLYYLAFRRSNKKLVSFEELLDPINIMTKPKLIHYLGIYKAIKEIIEGICSNPLILNSTISLRECEDSILYILQRAAKQINEI